MIDKRHGHEGVSQMTEFLGSMSMSDQLEPRLHYKPLLKAVLLARFKEIGESVFYAQDMHIAFGNEKGIYQLSDKRDGVYNAITHVRLNVSVPIPDDFRVTDESWTFVDNHSWLRCTLQGKKYNIKVFQVFLDCNQQRRIEYHRTSLLTELGTSITMMGSSLGPPWATDGPKPGTSITMMGHGVRKLRKWRPPTLDVLQRPKTGKGATGDAQRRTRRGKLRKT
jgi:hypothetical protein